MKLPLANQLKKRQQLETALLQDELVDIVYAVSDDMVFHGGTAIWRCYSGKRFSEDVDFYSISFAGKLNELETIVKAHGLQLSKIKDTGNVIFASVTDGRANVRLEVNHFVESHGVPTKYQLVDGTSIEVLCLTVEQLIIEKIGAYKDRKFARDLYDIYHLVDFDPDPQKVKESLRKFISGIERPVDEDVLKAIVYSGIPPSYTSMVDHIRRSIK